MEIREYQGADEGQVVGLWRAQLGGGWEEPADSLRRKVGAGDGLLLVAVEEGRLMGTAMGGYDGHRGWIYAICVEAGRRRQGVGTRLVREMEAELRRRGAAKINLQVRGSNREVVAFYESLGYVVEDRVSMGKRV